MSPIESLIEATRAESAGSPWINSGSRTIAATVMRGSSAP